MNKFNGSYRAIFMLLGWLITSLPASSQQSYELNSGWKYAQVTAVKEDGRSISSKDFSIANWLPAVVPGTVLTSMLANKQIPDPFYGMNNELIPDIYHAGNDHYTYWFVRDFKEAPAKGDGQVWLHLRGVNYSCEIFLNGNKVNDSTHKGMFLRQQYNITKLLAKDGNNRLAIVVYPPDPPGNPNGGQGGDGTIAKSVSHQYVAGWDWIQPIRDRNTGIWDKVSIEKTGAVNVSNTHVITKVPGTRRPGEKQDPAIVLVTTELHNASGRTIEGTVSCAINRSTVAQTVTLAAGETKTITLPNINLQDPKLWWPSGYGKQELTTLNVVFQESKKKLSDNETVTFGVREIQTEWNAHTRSRQISVNGQKIFIKGGNWIISDQMLRLSKERYDAEVRLHRDMNLNLIRIWGGALLERPEFYEACDRYGMLVFQDFWMSGDCNGRWKDRMKLEDKETRRQYPDDHDLFLRSAADQVKMIRNHPSLAIWCGGNEITPPDDILKALRDSLLPTLDGTRWFVDASTSDSMSLNTLGGNGDGPYGIQPTDTFWTHRTYPFNSEIGSVGTGDYESLKRFLPEQNLAVHPVYNGREQMDSVWRYHKYIGYSKYMLPYGEPKNVRDFAEKAQLVNYDQYRSLIEGFSAQMWNWYTGVIIWKTQNPWTALRGQMYDYYLDPNACLYGLRTGSEPMHVMYNPVEGSVLAVNNGFDEHKDISVTARAIDMNGRDTLLAMEKIALGATTVNSSFNIKKAVEALRAEKGTFLHLLMSSAGKTISENFYWLPDSAGNHSGLQQLQETRPAVTAKRLRPGVIEVTVNNATGGPVSFFNRVSLLGAGSDERLLPVFYSDNYFSVIGGQQKTLQLTYSSSAPVKNLVVEMRGWNTERLLVPVK